MKRAKPGLETSDLGGDLAVYDGERDSVHILNPTANLVYELALEGKSEAEIAAVVGGRYEVGPDQDIAADVRAIVAELRKKALLGK